ncbi:unnamed protein product [Gongylonema pulchrum]|uniref:Casein kinase II subunit beta n=1 Tax=Gongylonema pulchrum TaxID=637853 RepID=A0A183DJ58_9BILA|nr:unnamed protein product [Gongylonema pulchrum]
MYKKWQNRDFGTCPRFYCEKQPTLPIVPGQCIISCKSGLTDKLSKRPVMLYCPRCADVFYPKSSELDRIDGAYFGTGFPHMFFLTFPMLRPRPPTKEYVPRYGFLFL